MKVIMQHTIETAISGRGKGRDGNSIGYTLSPAPENTGIRVLRIDMPPTEVFNSKVVLSQSGWLHDEYFSIPSLKPMLSVLRALGIDNVIIEVEGAALPCMENSVELLVFLIKSAGKRTQHTSKRSIKLLQPLVVSEKGKWIRLIPSNAFRFACLNSSFQKAFPVHNFGSMIQFSESIFVTEICRARPLHEIKMQWDTLNESLESHQTSVNIKQKLVKEINAREILLSVSELSYLGVNLSLDYVSFNADDALREKLIENIAEHAELYFSFYDEVDEDGENNSVANYSIAAGLG